MNISILENIILLNALVDQPNNILESEQEAERLINNICTQFVNKITDENKLDTDICIKSLLRNWEIIKKKKSKASKNDFNNLSSSITLISTRLGITQQPVPSAPPQFPPVNSPTRKQMVVNLFKMSLDFFEPENKSPEKKKLITALVSDIIKNKLFEKKSELTTQLKKQWDSIQKQKGPISEEAEQNFFLIIISLGDIVKLM